MSNLKTVVDYIEEVKPTDCNFSVNYKWLMKNLNDVIDADNQGVLLNPEYLRAPLGVSFDGTIPDEPPVFDTW